MLLNLFLAFDLQHWPAVMLAFIPLLINLTILIYVLFFLPKTKLNVPFLLFLSILSVWQFNDTTVRLFTTEEEAHMWFDMLIIPITFMAPFALHFALVFTEKGKLLNSPWVLSLLYLPAISFALLTVGGFVGYNVIHSDFWGWTFYLTEEPLSHINGSWMGVLILITLVVLIQFTLQSKKLKTNKYWQAVLITVGFAIPALQGIITELIYPIFFQQGTVPITTATMSAFSLCTIIALSKYHLLAYSPQHAWENIVSYMNEGVVIVNNDDELQYANKKFTEITGYSESDLLGKNVSEALHQDNYHDIIEQMISRRKQHLSDSYEVEIFTKSGGKTMINIGGSPYYNDKGKVIGSVGIMTDLTPRVKAELALKESEQFLRTFVEESLLAIYLYDPQANEIIQANKSFFRLLGYSPNKLDTLTVYDFVDHPKKEIDKAFHDMKTNNKSDIGERVWKHKNGQQIDVLISYNNISQGGKDIVSVTAQDIGPLKKLEAKLQTKVNDLNMFVYRSSHDLRGPLASITGIVNLAKMEPNLTAETAHQYMDMITTSTKRLQDILTDLSDIAQITERQIELKPVLLEAELFKILADLKELPNFSRVQINVHVDQTGEYIADERLLLAVMQNLIANAINYADLRKKSPYIEIAAKHFPDYTRITVEDNGQGIEKEMHQSVFEMFYRGNEESQGTGLGLFIVRSALEKMGGTIELKSEKDEGSTFTLWLPSGNGVAKHPIPA